MLKLFVISLSFWLVLASTLLHFECWFKRYVCAIRQTTIEYEVRLMMLAFFWTLFLISILI